MHTHAMKPIVICCGLLACCCMPHSTVAQSAGDAAIISAFERRSFAAAEDWRLAKKICVLPEVPAQPKRQTDCLNPRALENGTTGYLEYWSFRVVGIIGKTDVLLAMGASDIPPIVISGFPTKGLADGDKVYVCGPVTIDGTKSYVDTDGAQRTVRIARLLTTEDIAKAERDRAAAEEEASYRTWTDTTGQHRTVARFDEFKNNQVTLKKKDGGSVSVPSSRLSEPDREFIRAELKKRREPKR